MARLVAERVGLEDMGMGLYRYEGDSQGVFYSFMVIEDDIGCFKDVDSGVRVVMQWLFARVEAQVMYTHLCEALERSKQHPWWQFWKRG